MKRHRNERAEQPLLRDPRCTWRGKYIVTQRMRNAVTAEYVLAKGALPEEIAICKRIRDERAGCVCDERDGYEERQNLCVDFHPWPSCGSTKQAQNRS